MIKKTLTAAVALAALLVPVAPAFATPGDTGTDTTTGTETDAGDRTIGDVIHDIFCPPEDDEEDEEDEETPAAPEPPKVEVAETPAAPVTTSGDRDEPVCSTDPRSVNYCPPLD